MDSTPTDSSKELIWLLIVRLKDSDRLCSHINKEINHRTVENALPSGDVNFKRNYYTTIFQIFNRLKEFELQLIGHKILHSSHPHNAA